MARSYDGYEAMNFMGIVHNLNFDLTEKQKWVLS